MGKKAMEDLKEMMCRELDDISKKGSLSTGDLDVAHKLTDTIKNIYKIDMLEQSSGGYSGGDWSARGSYGRMTGYSRDAAYRADGNYAKDGNYAQAAYDDDYPGAYSGMHYVRGHYSRDDGKEAMARQMRDMIDQGGMSQSDRQTLMKAMEVLQR